MNIIVFTEKFNQLKPSKQLMLDNGFSESFSDRVIENEFTLTSIKTIDNTKESLLDFLKLMDVENLTINKLSFSESLENIEEYIIVSGFEGGFLVKCENEEEIRVLYSDDIDSDIEVFCENDKQFFELLLIFTEYSKLKYEGKVKTVDLKVKNEFLERCNKIYPLYDYDVFL